MVQRGGGRGSPEHGRVSKRVASYVWPCITLDSREGIKPSSLVLCESAADVFVFGRTPYPSPFEVIAPKAQCQKLLDHLLNLLDMVQAADRCPAPWRPPPPLLCHAPQRRDVEGMWHHARLGHISSRRHNAAAPLPQPAA